MKKNPILVFTGLAIAAVAAITGLTRDKWMADTPQTVATPETVKVAEAPATPEEAAPAATAEPAAPAATTDAASPAAPDAAAPTSTTEAATTPATPETAPSTTTETAAAPQPEQQAPAEQSAVTAEAPPTQPAAEQQTAAAQPEQPASTPAVEPPAEVVQPEQQTAAAQPEQTPAPVEQPAEKTDVPSFDTVRVEKSGEAVIAGTAEAGSEVVVKFDGEEIGKTIANNDGAFVVIPQQPLPVGSGALTIESKGKGDLRATPSDQSVAVIVPAGAQQEALVAVVSPDAPTKVLQSPESAPEPEVEVAAAQPETVPAVEEPAQPPVAEPAKKPAAASKFVSIDAVDYDGSGNIVFSGQGQPGNTARVYVDNGFIGDSAIGENGRWNFSGTADVKQGVHQLRVDGLDTAGKVVNRVEVPFFRENQSTVAESAQPQQPEQTVAKTDAPEVEAGSTTPEMAAPSAEVPVTSGEQVAAAAQPELQVEPAQPKEGRVVIQPGNNLWRISRVLYGSGEKYTMLYKANKDQIRNPDLIYPGQIFKTPEVAAKVETVDPKRRDQLKPEENAASAP